MTTLTFNNALIVLDNLAYVIPKDHKRSYTIEFCFISNATHLTVTYDNKEERDNHYKELVNQIMRNKIL